MIGRGFYGVVDVEEPGAALALAEALIAGGATTLQLRLKRAPARGLVAVGRALRALTRLPLVINDRLDVALIVGADFVHLGQDDLPLAAARGRLSVGISTHNLEQAVAAAQGGADYLGFGPVFATATKQNPDPIQGVAALAAVVRAVAPLPVVAIGGINAVNAAAVAAEGAWAACAISAVNQAADPAATARRIAQCFG